jgi:hypothetical protein
MTSLVLDIGGAMRAISCFLGPADQGIRVSGSPGMPSQPFSDCLALPVWLDQTFLRTLAQGLFLHTLCALAATSSPLIESNVRDPFEFCSNLHIESCIFTAVIQ